MLFEIQTQTWHPCDNEKKKQTGTLTERSARLTKRDRQKLRLRQRRETERRERQWHTKTSQTDRQRGESGSARENILALSTFRTLPIWTRRESSMKTTLRRGHRSSSSPFFSSSLEGVAAFFRSVQTQQGMITQSLFRLLKSPAWYTVNITSVQT